MSFLNIEGGRKETIRALIIVPFPRKDGTLDWSEVDLEIKHHFDMMKDSVSGLSEPEYDDKGYGISYSMFVKPTVIPNADKLTCKMIAYFIGNQKYVYLQCALAQPTRFETYRREFDEFFYKGRYELKHH
jgi:hypothetical protein